MRQICLIQSQKLNLLVLCLHELPNFFEGLSRFIAITTIMPHAFNLLTIAYF